MMKKPTAAILAALLALSLCGCRNLFEKEYYTEEPYTPVTQEEEPLEDTISNYTALKRAITNLVSAHVESAVLELRDYDGTIGQDISTACWEVKADSALGAFAVDYISYDTTRIVSYYQVQIFITYKRTAEQVLAIESAFDLRQVRNRLSSALENGETYLALRIGAASVTADDVAQFVQDAYYENAALTPALPAVSVSTFPEEGVDRILEISLNYGLDAETLQRQREELAAMCELMTADLLPEEETESPEGDSLPPTRSTVPDRQSDMAFSLAQRLGDACVLVSAEEAAAADTTACGALLSGHATDEGLAMAYQLLCRAAGIDCVTVRGRYDNEEHFWNILTVDGISAHVDMSRRDEGLEAMFLLPDALMEAYRWDTASYPVCDTDYDYFLTRTEKEPEVLASDTEPTDADLPETDAPLSDKTDLPGGGF